MARNARNLYNQERRQMKFPDDRIAFYKNAYNDDINDIEQWVKSKQTMKDMELLCRRIAYNNYLTDFFRDEMIPVHMMLNELKIMGYPHEIF